MSYRQATLEQYLSAAAGGEPTPGGGSVSALAGALAAAMGQMAANFTAGRKAFAGVDEQVRGLLAELAAGQEALLRLVDLDAEAYGAVTAAYSLPRETAPQKSARQAAVQAALRGAMEPPLEVMRQCAAVSRACESLAGIGNPRLIGDVGVGAILAEAACAAARLNVEANLKWLTDRALCKGTRAELDELSRTTRGGRERTLAEVNAHLCVTPDGVGDRS